MIKTIRLEVNIDVLKAGITPEVVRDIVKEILLRGLGRYVELQTVKITK